MGRDMSDIILEIHQRLLALPSGKEQKLEGASEEEIQELDKYAGGQLPFVYKQFLRLFGRSAGELLRGSEYSVIQQFRLHLREHAEEILVRTKATFALPKEAFVFLMSQGYQFTFFYIDEGDDPTIYHYLEGDDTPRVLDSSLSGYLRRCIEHCEQREQHLKSNQ
jgi:hypothetical protein